MNRRRTIKRRGGLGRLLGRTGNRRVRPRQGKTAGKEKVQEARQEAASGPGVDLRALLRRALGVCLFALKLTVALALLGAAALGGYYTYRRVMSSTYFNVREITVQSTRRAPTDQILRLLEPARGKNLLTLDMAALRRAVVAHPWVRDAELERQLPATLLVRVTEHKARALLMMGHLYLVDAEGQVFKRAEPDECGGMPVITGISRMGYLNHPRKAHARIARALEALDRYYDKVRPKLSEVHIGKRDEISLYLQRGGVALRMGDEVTDERLRKMDAVWAALGPEMRRARAVFLDNVARKDRVTVRMGQYQ